MSAIQIIGVAILLKEDGRFLFELQKPAKWRRGQNGVLRIGMGCIGGTVAQARDLCSRKTGRKHEFGVPFVGDEAKRLYGPQHAALCPVGYSSGMNQRQDVPSIAFRFVQKSVLHAHIGPLPVGKLCSNCCSLIGDRVESQDTEDLSPTFGLIGIDIDGQKPEIEVGLDGSVFGDFGDALASHPVEPWSPPDPLAVAAEISVTEIVRHDPYDIGSIDLHGFGQKIRGCRQIASGVVPNNG